MKWKRDRKTGHHHATGDDYKARIQPGFWGNSVTPAWKIYVNGHLVGTELTMGAAKLEVVREVKKIRSVIGA